MPMPDFANRRRVAAAHARRLEHPYRGRILARLERSKECLRPLELAGDGIADADRRWRRRRLALLHDVEMRVKGRDLVDSRLRQPHFIAQSSQMARGEIVVAVLDEMQEFDQKIGPARPRTKQFTNLPKRVLGKLPSLGKTPSPPPRSGIAGPPILASAGCEFSAPRYISSVVISPGWRRQKLTPRTAGSLIPCRLRRRQGRLKGSPSFAGS